VAEDDDQARKEGATELQRYLDFFVALDKPWQSADYAVYGKGLGEFFAKMSYDVMDQGDALMFGSPERCVQRIKNIKQGLGLSDMLFEVNFGGMTHEKVMKSLERFAKYVLPQVRNV
jgi:alkanesulfonate monooxygenase SsuD/methylene tetrahydromethanopterin reductase-like flavin-dependent oxidoreductase (luciferase family)